MLALSASPSIDLTLVQSWRLPFWEEKSKWVLFREILSLTQPQNSSLFQNHKQNKMQWGLVVLAGLGLSLGKQSPVPRATADSGQHHARLLKGPPHIMWKPQWTTYSGYKPEL